jgi:DNA-binding HxlR family transcriptional regulator
MRCSVARALSVIGDRWTMLILRDTFLGIRRFADFEERAPMSRHRLAARLKKLTAEGILARVKYQEHPPRFEYRLTEKGIDLYPVIVAMLRWGDRWMAGSEGPPIELVHRGCGRQVTPTLTCPACKQEVNARTMTARPGRAASARPPRRFEENSRHARSGSQG